MGDAILTEPILNDIMTLEEASQYLKVAKEQLEEMAINNKMPAQRFGNDWRFSKTLILDWMRTGQVETSSDATENPIETLIQEIRQLVQTLQTPPKPTKPKKGSFEAIERHIGHMKGKEDPDEILAKMRAIREEYNG